MTYYVKSTRKAQYTGRVIIKAGQEVAVDKDTYEYLQSTFGACNWFKFRTSRKKVSPVEVTTIPEIQPVDVVMDSPKPTKKSTRKSKK